MILSRYDGIYKKNSRKYNTPKSVMNTHAEYETGNSGQEILADPFISIAIHRMASDIVNQSASVQPGEKVLLWFDPPGTPLVEELMNRCLAKGAFVSYFRRDLEADAQLIPKLTETEIAEYFDQQKRLIADSDVVLIVRGPANPEALKDVPEEKLRIYNEQYTRAHRPRITGETRWTLFYWPLPYEAEKEGMEYGEYFRLVLEACNQPWKEIKAAQKKLVDKLNGGKTLELIANPDDPDPERRTHVTMSIEGMTFANSTIDLNFPGSEVFSAPVKDSVNGQIFAPGEYLSGSKLMKDIILRIENGRIVEAHAAGNDEALQEILNSGEGARYFGEVALGTNPGLRRRLFNTLLNEKVGGSFHMAIGHCYEFDTYSGEPVSLNNGNTEDLTPVHWDLTVLMHPQYGGGRVVLDGENISENGQFLDPELSVLNPDLS
ncbi:hypothetical protein A2Z33_01735 [Candidatus Gottesmanbacteria bacterium RBG_16_52_11]|uniref:Aminopeptidase n=1 Tax=Candidatus Gottesmanbacteria bacterium RBG_16_52_11 TaxID=1798374 RepID=A0A1F5YP22_9BACT|nr:MAG: hypothetical protein A2Z33_01735 [Candidatus Gottesmanbacteria bacterium RBG_16_52_11]